MNRFYRPSAPRYTSQFVEDKYPMELYYETGIMKQQQQQAFAEASGELAGLISIAPSGPRTNEVGKEVRNELLDNLNNWVSSNQANYDSPQAVSDLSRMRTEFLNNPDIQLMKQDHEDYQQIHSRSRAGMKQGDIDPNTNYLLGTFDQFTRGDPYEPYKPVIGAVDTPKRILEELGAIPKQRVKRPYRTYEADPLTGQPVEKTGHKEFDVRTMEMMEGPVQNLVERYYTSSEDWAIYQRESDKRTYGEVPQPEEIYNRFKRLAEQRVELTDLDTASYDASIAGAGASTDTDSTGYLAPMGVSQRYIGDEKSFRKIYQPQKQIQRHAIRTGKMRDLDNSIETQQIVSLLSRNDPDFKNDNNLTKVKKIHSFVKDLEKRTSAFEPVVRMLSNDDRRELMQMVNLSIDDKGEAKLSGKNSFLIGANIVNLDTGEEIQGEKEKSNLFKEGTVVSFYGPPREEDIPLMHTPNSVIFDYKTGRTQGKASMRMMPENSEHDYNNRLIWNIGSAEADPVSKVGRVFAFTVGAGGRPRIDDIDNDRNASGKAENISVNYPQTLYFVPYVDFNDGLYKMNVYTQNPLPGKKKENNTIDKDIFTPSRTANNPYFLDQISSYDNSDYMYMYEKLITPDPNTDKTLYEDLVNKKIDLLNTRK